VGVDVEVGASAGVEEGEFVAPGGTGVGESK
jgi:hypothetical protein